MNLRNKTGSRLRREHTDLGSTNFSSPSITLSIDARYLSQYNSRHASRKLWLAYCFSVFVEVFQRVDPACCHFIVFFMPFGLTKSTSMEREALQRLSLSFHV